MALKEFIASLTLKAKIIAVSTAVVVTGGVATTVGVLASQEDEYRVIKVFEMTGEAVVEREDTGSISAYTGMNLENGDVLTVGDESTLRIVMDEDKYVMLDSGTVLKLNATGSSEDSNTRIELMKGEILNEITASLSSGSVYEVATPKAVMAVRGTSFVVRVEEDGEGGYLTREQTLQGKVQVELLSPEGKKTGKSVIVDEDKNVSISTIPNENSNNPAEIDGTSLFIIENAEGGYDIVYDPDEALSEIDYDKISDNIKEIAIYSDDTKLMVLDDEVARKIRAVLSEEADNEPETTVTEAVTTPPETTATTTTATSVSVSFVPPFTQAMATVSSSETAVVTVPVTETEALPETAVPETSASTEAQTSSEETTTEAVTTTSEETTAEETTTEETTAEETTASTTEATTAPVTTVPPVVTPVTTTTPETTAPETVTEETTAVPETTTTPEETTTPETTTTPEETTTTTEETTTTPETTPEETTTAEEIVYNIVQAQYNNVSFDIEVEEGEELNESDLPSLSDLGLSEDDYAFVYWRDGGTAITFPYTFSGDITLIADPVSYINIKFVGLDYETLLETRGWSMHSVNDAGIIPPEVPNVSEGCFIKWMYYGEVMDFDSDLSGDYTFSAEEFVRVTFVDMDGNEITNFELMRDSKSISSSGGTMPTIPTVEGYKATRWIDSDGNEVDEDTKFTTSVTVTPDYSLLEYVTVTFNDINGNAIDTLTIEKGTSVAYADGVFPTIPTVEGHTATRWLDTEGNEVTDATVITTDLVLTPDYTPDTIDITFKDIDGNTLASYQLNWGESLSDRGYTIPDIPERTDYIIDKWVGENGMDYGTITVNSVFTDSYVFIPRYTPTISDSIVGGYYYTLVYTVESQGYALNSAGDTTATETQQILLQIINYTPYPEDGSFFRYYVNGTEFSSSATVNDILTAIGYENITDDTIYITLVADTL